MKSKLVLVATAIFLGAAGLALTFAPDEVARRLSPQGGDIVVRLAQFAGALCLGSATANWMCRDNSVGGIYGRPLTIGNLVQFLVAGLSLGKAVVAGHREPVLVVVASCCFLLALAFSVIAFGPSKVGVSK